MILLYLFSLFFATPSHALCNSLELDFLRSFSSKVYPPLNWTSTVDCCYWEGIGCDSSGRVTRLWLPSKGIHGTISPAISNLTSLSHLNLSHNSLSGPLPDMFLLALNQTQVIDLSFNSLSGPLPNSLPMTIEKLDFSSNRFNGTIQASFFTTATNLLTFNSSNNSFVGPIPSYMCRTCPFLSLLDFSFNKFTGEIPLGFGECLNLKVLRADFNNLVGPIPPDIYSCQKLEEISFPGNFLTGEIKEGITNLSSLKILSLFGNELNGFIPGNIGKLSNLEKLQLHMNSLTGSLPASLSNCENLTILNLCLNSLYGDISRFDFSKFIHLKTIDLGANGFKGSLPQSLFSCKTLTAIRLSSNKFTGELASSILELQSLSFLSVSNNSLSNITVALQVLKDLGNLRTLVLASNFYNENLPSIDTGGFQNLQILGLGGCQFSGQIPKWLATLKSLELIDLSHNHITGLIPGWLGNLSNLFYIDLSGNMLNGVLPKELMGLRCLGSEHNLDEVKPYNLESPLFIKPNANLSLQYIKLSGIPPAMYLGNNRLSGDIPVEIARLKLLHVLDLSGNNFSGEIPDGISHLTNLEKLDLSGNHISGEIPASLKNLHFLSAFSVAHNNLEGPVPTGGQFDTFSDSSFEGNAGLCGLVLQRPCDNYQATPPMDTSSSGHEEKFISLLFIWWGLAFGFSVTILVLWIPPAGHMLVNRIISHFVIKC